VHARNRCRVAVFSCGTCRVSYCAALQAMERTLQLRAITRAEAALAAVAAARTQAELPGSGVLLYGETLSVVDVEELKSLKHEADDVIGHVSSCCRGLWGAVVCPVRRAACTGVAVWAARVWACAQEQRGCQQAQPWPAQATGAAAMQPSVGLRCCSSD
jgi:hypothetical protein